MTDFGANVKRRRLQLGLTQQQLADRLHYKDRSTIARIETGANDVPMYKISAIAEALETTSKRLIYGQETESGSIQQQIIQRIGKLNHDELIQLRGYLNGKYGM